MYYMTINKYVMINSNHNSYVKIIYKFNYYTEYIRTTRHQLPKDRNLAIKFVYLNAEKLKRRSKYMVIKGVQVSVMF